MSSWQPIKTAPTDGTAVLLFVPSLGLGGKRRDIGLRDVVVGVFASQNGTRAWYSDVGYVEYYHTAGEGIEFEELNPTHWTPLPDDPDDP